MTPGEGKLKSYDLAAEVSKQIITLSTTIVTVSIALAGSKWQDGPSSLAITSWIMFLFAIFFALWTLSALTGSINQGQDDINKFNIAFPALMQGLLFLSALTCAGVFGYKSMSKTSEKEKVEKIIIESRINNETSRVDTIIYKQ
jgi:hypothetical protein